MCSTNVYCYCCAVFLSQEDYVNELKWRALRSPSASRVSITCKDLESPRGESVLEGCYRKTDKQILKY